MLKELITKEWGDGQNKQTNLTPLDISNELP